MRVWLIQKLMDLLWPTISANIELQVTKRGQAAQSFMEEHINALREDRANRQDEFKIAERRHQELVECLKNIAKAIT